MKVEGFPLRLNEFGVAQLFGELGVTSVTIRGSSATVIFTNKFHALQAMELNNKVTLILKAMPIYTFRCLTVGIL